MYGGDTVKESSAIRSGTVNQKGLDDDDDIVHVCWVLVNLQPPILSNTFVLLIIVLSITISFILRSIIHYRL